MAEDPFAKEDPFEELDRRRIGAEEARARFEEVWERTGPVLNPVELVEVIEAKVACELAEAYYGEMLVEGMPKLIESHRAVVRERDELRRVQEQRLWRTNGLDDLGWDQGNGQQWGQGR